MVKRGDVWLSNLDPTVGSEIQKSRPCLIISPPEMRDYLRTVPAAPMTTRGWPAMFRLKVGFAGKDGLVLLDQLRALDKRRLLTSPPA